VFASTYSVVGRSIECVPATPNPPRVVAYEKRHGTRRLPGTRRRRNWTAGGPSCEPCDLPPLYTRTRYLTSRRDLVAVGRPSGRTKWRPRTIRSDNRYVLGARRPVFCASVRIRLPRGVSTKRGRSRTRTCDASVGFPTKIATFYWRPARTCTMVVIVVV